MKDSFFTRSLLVRVMLVAGIMLALFGSSRVAKADAAPPGLILWNRLGSDAEVLNSEFGPDLGFYMSGDCQNPSCGDGIEVKGNAAYIPGVFGNALTLGDGAYFTFARVHNTVLRDDSNYLGTEHGAVEMWFLETADPLPRTYGIYRLFDGAFGLGNGIGVWVQTPNSIDIGPARLMFSLSGVCNVASDSDGQLGYGISSYNNTWIHVAAVWDRSGIEGTSKTMQLFVDGAPVASTTCTSWHANTGTIDIGGGNDEQTAGKFAVDNLKVWNYAKTNYSDRFVEGFSPMLEVTVDIKPGDDTNPINLQSKGVIPVAILSTSTFDAGTVDSASVKFGPNQATSESSGLEDVNADGLLDMVLHFRTQETGIQPGDTQACLTGQTQTDVLIRGCDKIHILIPSSGSKPGPSAPKGLILWNKLDSDDEVLNSAYGPDLGFYMPGDCQNAGCLDFVEVKGNPAYILGVFGNALTLGPGPYFSQAREHNAVLRDSGNYLDSERGAVEMWYWEAADPLPWTYGIYRLFGGAYGLGDGIGVYVQTPDQYNVGPARLIFTLSGVCNVESDSDGQLGYDISAYNDTWIHVAAVWDRSGIQGTSKTMQLFINGDPVASTACSNWTANRGTIDIGGGNDDQIDHKFAVDNLKVWDYAKTDYSDRFLEGFKPSGK